MSRALVVAVALLLSGCDTGELSRTPNGEFNYGVREIQLQDGTRCVMLTIRAITCDWSSAKAAQP